VSAQYDIFRGLDADRVDAILAALPAIHYNDGDVIVREGQDNDQFHLIESGTATVWTASDGAFGPVQVATLKAGDCFGEMSVLAGGKISATLKAHGKVILRRLRLDQLPDVATRESVITNLSRVLVSRLGNANVLINDKHEQRMRAVQMQLDASEFLTKSLIMLSVYIFLLPFGVYVNEFFGSDSVYSSALILAFLGVTYRFVKSSSIPARAYGMTLDNWPQQFWIGLKYSIPFIGVFLALKGILVAVQPETFSWFEPGRFQQVGAQDSLALFCLIAASYCILTFAQEFIRCAVQGSLSIFYKSTDQVDRWKSIIVANVVFAALHVHLGPIFAAAAFISGLFWGWMYHVTGSYLAAASSHALVGVVLIFVFGLPF